MPLTANKDRQNMWDVACALYHALCKVWGTHVLCCRVCLATPLTLELPRVVGVPPVHMRSCSKPSGPAASLCSQAFKV